MIKLYSNHCPKCDIIKEKLDEKNISYELIDDVEWLTANGFDRMPVLEINGQKITSMLQMSNIIRSL